MLPGAPESLSLGSHMPRLRTSAPPMNLNLHSPPKFTNTTPRSRGRVPVSRSIIRGVLVAALLWLHAATVAQSCSYTGSVPPNGCYDMGVDYSGNDIGDWNNADTPAACQQACAAHASCRVWTRRESGSRCYFKTSSSGRRCHIISHISGPRTCGELDSRLDCPMVSLPMRSF